MAKDVHRQHRCREEEEWELNVDVAVRLEIPAGGRGMEHVLAWLAGVCD